MVGYICRAQKKNKYTVLRANSTKGLVPQSVDISDNRLLGKENFGVRAIEN